LPDEDIPLRIFESRYKQLINECLEREMNFGIPFLRNSEIQAFGVECKINQVVARNSKGEMVIVVIGISNFEVVSYKDSLPGKLYSGGLIHPITKDRPVQKSDLLRMLMNYTNNLDSDFLKDLKGRKIMINDVARALNLSSEDKFNFISIRNPDMQEQFLKAQLMYLIKLREQERLLNNDYMLN